MYNISPISFCQADIELNVSCIKDTQLCWFSWWSIFIACSFNSGVHLFGFAPSRPWREHFFGDGEWKWLVRWQRQSWIADEICPEIFLSLSPPLYKQQRFQMGFYERHREKTQPQPEIILEERKSQKHYAFILCYVFFFLPAVLCKSSQVKYYSPILQRTAGKKNT